MRRLRSAPWLAAAASLAFGCQPNTSTQPPAVLNRSGDVSLVCYDVDAPDDAALVLPLQCCAGALPLATSFPACPVAATTPTLHGLITQTARGEVAAVNLDDNLVVDSDKLIPGYTFVDVGGLPQALVVPNTELADDTSGPSWAFVAGGDLGVVQAVATCRFFRGERCGPELAFDADGLTGATRVVLPGAPGDMVRAADGSALWVTIPDRGLLARVALSDDPAVPFAMVDGVPAEPSYFAVPAPRATTPLEALPEADTYRAACGLGYELSAASEQLPLAPRMELDAARAPRPTRLRVDDATGLLFVADAAGPVLRAFAQGDAGLSLVGEWNTGLPISDFALTAAVPATAPSLAALVSATDVPGSVPEDSVRYLYAIDDQGLVQAFGLGGDAAAPSLQAIAPTLASLSYRDRVRVTGRAVALDIIDTRLREPYLCGADETDLAGARSELNQRVDDARKARDDAKAARDAALLAERQAELDKLSLEQSIRANAAPGSLRGVFVAVVSSVGALDLLDVHDLDLACRAAMGCSGTSPHTELRNTTASEGFAAGTGQSLAVQRHSERISGAGNTTVSVAGESELTRLNDENTCPDGSIPGYTNSLGDTLVCLPADPWFAADQTWGLAYEGRIPTLTASGGMLSLDDDGALWVSLPPGFDLCQRGIELGDGVYITTDPASGAPASCPRATTGAVARLRVLEAFSDRVRVEPADADGPDAATLVGCYPQFVGIEVHPLGQYLVLGADGAYLHRIISDDQGRCVADETKDARLESRITPPTSGSVLFENPFVAFSVQASDDPANVALSVRVAGQSARLTLAVQDSNGRVDTLPSRVRYFPEAPHLFVVDAASQGLRRFVLSPRVQQTTAFR